MAGEKKKVKAWRESRTKDKSEVVNGKPCLMKGEKELVTDEGLDGRGKEAQQKALFDAVVISLLGPMSPRVFCDNTVCRDGAVGQIK